MVDPHILNLLGDYINLLNNEGFAIGRAFLYGSYVTGRNTASSDIDVLLVLGSTDEPDIRKKSRAWALTRKVDSRIEPYLISAHRFDHDESSPLFEIVRREGIEIRF